MAPAVSNTLKTWRLACPKGELELVFSTREGGIENHTTVLSRLMSLETRIKMPGAAGRPRNIHGMQSVTFCVLGYRTSDPAPLYEAPCVNAYWIVCGAAAKRIRDRPRLIGLRRSPASPYIRSARIGACTHIPHARGSREVEADGTHLFDGNQSPGGCRSTSFPVRRRQPVVDAASKLAYAFNSAP
jgi:hypothetical protein